jgi:hypothetical protein
MIFLALALMALLGIQLAHPAIGHAATLTVNANCTLVDAISAANTGTNVGGCRGGSRGTDTIVLSQDVVLTAVHNRTSDGPNGLPPVTSDITILGNGFSITRSTAANTPVFRIFEVESGARLRLTALTLRNGRIAGGTGRAGAHARQPGSDGEDGERGSVGFVVSGAGGPGEDGDSGRTGGSGRIGGVAQGGAILNRGTLELEDCTVADNAVVGGAGGTGGNGSKGGKGGEGGNPGIPIPLVIIAVLGPPGGGGDGGAGGVGGAGGSGGPAQGGAIYHAGEALTISGCTFENNQAQGGRGGVGGRGGASGEGGNGGIGQEFAIGSGGDGGKGGPGGVGGHGGDGQGGALYNTGGKFTISLSTIRNSQALGGAGNRGGTGNRGADGALESGGGGFGGAGGAGGTGGHGQGGALFNESGVALIERTMLLDNRSQGGGGGTGNTAGDSGDGGGLVGRWVAGLEEFTAVVRDILLESIMSGSSVGGVGGNGGNGGSGQGGAIFTASGTLTIAQSSLANSRTEPGTGGAGGKGGLSGYPNELMRELALRLPNREIGPGGDGVRGQIGSSYGGGVHADSALLEISRSTLNRNRAGAGGALWLRRLDSDSRIINSTLAGNSASIQGGGIDSAPVLALGSTIVAGNTAPAGPDINGPIESLDYNLIGNRTGAILNGPTRFTLFDILPNFGTLDDNGGPTATIALQPGSPAVNRGSCHSATDQRGYFRIDRRCDIGAFEQGATQQPWQAPPALVDDSEGSIRAGLPAGVHANVIASDGVFSRSAAEVGVQGLLDLGVINAIDIFSLGDEPSASTMICFQGSDNILFLAATGSPRVPQRLPVFYRLEHICAWITEPGTVVQVAS